MPSRAETRGVIEAVLRVASIAMLAWMLWLSLDSGRPEMVVSARSVGLDPALRAWTRAGTAPDRIAAQFDSTPSPTQRDWLGALRSAGRTVTWSGDLPATAISVRRVASPQGGFMIQTAAPEGARVRLFDDVGVLDTANAHAGGARFAIPFSAGIITARVGGTVASAGEPDSITIKRLLVIGRAGWESKFVVAALEEDDWKVDARMRIAPGVNVTQGANAEIDTARYSAVIALDESAAPYSAAIAGFVSTGGGLVLSGTAASLDAFAGVRPGAPGRVTGGAVLASEPGAISLRSLSLIPVSGLKGDAIVLERRDGAAAVAVRRHVAGRVLQQGYVDTWRWRMSGDDQSLAAHRAWWTRSVAGVAYAPNLRSHEMVEADRIGLLVPLRRLRDNAPYARMIASLGEATGQSGLSVAGAGSISGGWMFAFLSFFLLAELASRRFRGRR